VCCPFDRPYRHSIRAELRGIMPSSPATSSFRSTRNLRVNCVTILPHAFARHLFACCRLASIYPYVRSSGWFWHPRPYTICSNTDFSFYLRNHKGDCIPILFTVPLHRVVQFRALSNVHLLPRPAVGSMIAFETNCHLVQH
jgi:hypothetical protein